MTVTLNILKMEQFDYSATYSNNDDEAGNTKKSLQKINESTLRCLRQLYHSNERKLNRTSVFRYLKCHLKDSSEKVRYLTLEVLCSTVAKVGPKADGFLGPLTKTAMLCLRGKEHREIRCKALHFLRGCFCRTGNRAGFVKNFIRTGIKSKDLSIQTASLAGFNIVFPLDMDSILIGPLVVSIATLLDLKEEILTRHGYRALKFIHDTVGADEFLTLLSKARPESLEIFQFFNDYEDSDPFLTFEDKHFDTLIAAYIGKRNEYRLRKDFGILDKDVLDRVKEMINDRKATAVEYLASMLRESQFAYEDVESQMADLLKLVEGLVLDPDRQTQMHGFDIFQHVIERTGFYLASHIRLISEMLRKSMTSANFKIQSKTDKVVWKLMRSIDYMLLIRELLKTTDAFEKEAVLILLEKKLKYFPHHELDVISLCKILGENLEDDNRSLAKHCRTCVSQLLDILQGDPCCGDRSKALEVLFQNYQLSKETLIEIDAVELLEESGNESSEGKDTDEMIETDSLEGTEGTLVSTKKMHGSTQNTKKSASRETLSSVSETDQCNAAQMNSSAYSTAEEIPTNFEETLDIGVGSRDLDKDGIHLENICSFNGEASSSMETVPVPKKRKYKTFFCIKKSQELRRDLDAKAGGDITLHRISPIATQELNYSSNDVTESYQQNGAQVDVLRTDFFNFNIMTVDHISHGANIEEIDPDMMVASISEIRQEGAISLATPIVKNQENEKLHQHRNQAVNTSPTLGTTDHTTDGPRSGDDFSETHSSNIIKKTSKSKNSLESSKTSKITFIESRDMKSSGPSRDEKAVLNKNSSFRIENEQTNDEVPGSENVLQCHKRCRKHSSKKKSKKDFTKVKRKPDFQNGTTIGDAIYERDDSLDVINRGKQRKVKDGSVKDVKQNYSPPCHGNAIAAVDSQQLKNIPTFANTVDEGFSPAENAHSDEGFSIPGREGNKEFIQQDYSSSDYNRRETYVLPQEVIAYSTFENLDDMNLAFLPKGRELPRTPVLKDSQSSMDIEPLAIVRPKVSNKAKKAKKKKEVRKDPVEGNQEAVSVSEQVEGDFQKTVPAPTVNRKVNSHNWKDCQWRSQLDFAAKATSCNWTIDFEKTIDTMEPLPATLPAEAEMKRAIDELIGKSWKLKDKAMQKIIQIAMFHREAVQANGARITIALSDETRNFMNSVAGRAIFTIGHLYALMGKCWEGNLHVVIGALLAKSGSRNLSAHYRLVVQSLAKVIANSTATKAAMAIIQEGCKQSSKAARETAAQFLCILANELGTENCMNTSMASYMMKCAAQFLLDCSHLNRYCAKRMFLVFMKHPDYKKLLNQHLDFKTISSLGKTLEQLKAQGVKDEALPISLIE